PLRPRPRRNNPLRPSADRKFKSTLGTFALRPRRAAAARPSGPPQGVARLALVLDLRLRMGEDSASGVPWGDGLGSLGKGDVSRRRGDLLYQSSYHVRSGGLRMAR